MGSIFYIILVVILIVVLIILAKYNSLVRFYNRVKKAGSDIEVYLNKRFDLIPNIVETVKGYSKHEESTLEKIVKLRSKYNENNHMDIKNANEMNNELTKYLAIVENYPELKANSEYMNLQKELREIEDQLEIARRNYNDVVNRYNTAIEVVPSNIVAGIFGFKKASFFQIDDDKKENIKVKI